MSVERKTDPNRKSSKPKRRRRWEFILKVILKGAARLYTFYKVVSKLIDFFNKEFMD